MGHDIIGFRMKQHDQVAYLWRGASSSYTNMYRWLDIEEHGAGDLSGDGTIHIFSADQIRDALIRSRQGYVEEDETAFLRNCLKAALEDENGEVAVFVG